VGIGVGIGASWAADGCGSARRGAADGCESAHRGAADGWEMIVVVRRAVWGFGALVGGLAGIASDVSVITKPCAAILDSPYSDTILDGTSQRHDEP
jgi:hypothetical protein